ncbi:hypothetical protein, conserved [Leishmania tarentolae]|uniref:RING-type E3 ubiquitin transferase n=1 Tax=Leishmania tarentolae TaxID=5689 RepID=A0A640KQL1_LEITA|nr:hypothetical protein, conserved [Leishmania tarentolae]
MLSAMDSSASPVDSSPSAKHYAALFVPSPDMLNLVEKNLMESCSDEVLEPLQLASVTSSGGGIRASALSPNRMGKSMLTVEERENVFTTLTPNSQSRQKSDTVVRLSRSASVERSQKERNSELKEIELREFSALPQEQHISASVDTCASPVQRSVSSRQLGRSVSLTFSVLTPRPTEDFLPSSTHSNPLLVPEPLTSPTVREQADAVLEDAEECCICLEVYTKENPMLRGACQHHFHLPCLMEWKQRSSLCPMCCTETLRGIGEMEVPHQSGPLDPAEAARQRAIVNRDAEIAYNLQKSYIQAQRRDRQRAYHTQLSQSLRALHRGSPSSSISRIPPHIAEADEHDSSSLQTQHRYNRQGLGSIFRHSPPPGNARQYEVTANGQSQLAVPAVPSSIQGRRRSRSKSHPGCTIM